MRITNFKNTNNYNLSQNSSIHEVKVEQPLYWRTKVEPLGGCQLVMQPPVILAIYFLPPSAHAWYLPESQQQVLHCQELIAYGKLNVFNLTKVLQIGTFCSLCACWYLVTLTVFFLVAAACILLFSSGSVGCFFSTSDAVFTE